MAQVLSVPNDFFQRASLRPEVPADEPGVVRQRPRQLVLRRESRLGFVSQGDVEIPETMGELGVFQGLQRAINGLAKSRDIDQRLRVDGVLGEKTLELFREAGGNTAGGTKTLARNAERLALDLQRLTSIPVSFLPNTETASSIALQKIRESGNKGGGGSSPAGQKKDSDGLPLGLLIAGGLATAGIVLAMIGFGRDRDR